MYTKKNARVTFKSNRRSGFRRNNNNYSNGKIRNKGNITQQYNKYLKLAKEAFSSGDRVQSEYYYQFTDHYYRLMVELGLNFDETDSNVENKNDDSKQNETSLEVENVESDNSQSNSNDQSSKEDESIESIESIPFIAKPAKKKSARTTK